MSAAQRYYCTICKSTYETAGLCIECGVNVVLPANPANPDAIYRVPRPGETAAAARRRPMFIPPDEPLHVTLRVGLLVACMVVGIALMIAGPGDVGAMVFGFGWLAALLWTVVQP